MHSSAYRLRAWNRPLTREHGKRQIIYSSEHVALFVVARDASEPGVCIWTSGEHLHLMAWLSFETRRHSIIQKQLPAKSCQFSVMQACSHCASLAAAFKIKSADIALSLIVFSSHFVFRLHLFMFVYAQLFPDYLSAVFDGVYAVLCLERAACDSAHSTAKHFFFSKKHCSFDLIKCRHDTDV